MKGLLLLCLFCLAGCLRPGADTALRLAEDGFREQSFQGEACVLKAWLRPAKTPGGTLHVYVEGDGRAWLNRHVVSPDPTPGNPVGLHLALADPTREALLYLARPGQYLAEEELQRCDPVYWTAARMAPEVVADGNRVVDAIKSLSTASSVALYGYSGGGGLAALMAVERNDVVFLGTVAGVLDHAWWTQNLRISPLARSLNPVDAARALAAVPQLHVAGMADDVVAPAISERFCQAVASPAARRAALPGMEHEGPWERYWPELLREYRNGARRFLPPAPPVHPQSKSDRRSPVAPSAQAGWATRADRAP